VFIEKRTSSRGAVSYRVQVRRQGVEISKTFKTKARAREWGIQAEAGITGESRPLGKHTALEAIRRYAEEVSPGKRGGRWERVRFNAMEGDDTWKKALASLSSDHLGAWRDKRLKAVGPATVRREINLLSAVWERARLEWKWVKVNPWRDVSKPQEPPARRRGVTQGELSKISGVAHSPAEREVLAGFELAIETGMRAGELWSLSREQIDGDVAHLERTKNGDSRDVALSTRAMEIVAELLSDGRPMLFSISNAVRDTIFRRMRDAAGLPDLHFHDSRSEAVSRLSKVLRVQDLADQVGHRDINSLMLYYKPSAKDRARLLAAAPQTTPSPPKRPTAGGRSRRGG
jgi:integrase